MALVNTAFSFHPSLLAREGEAWRENLATRSLNYTAYTFTQPRDHFDVSDNATFEQRYWFSDRYYRPSGPIIMMDSGEYPGDYRLPFLETGILQILTSATGGLGVILENRYYGMCLSRLNVMTGWLTYSQTLADSARFISRIKFDGINETMTAPSKPWILYGGSYAGARVAHLRVKYPELVFGAIGSSAVTYAKIEFWEYYEAIRRSANQTCIAHLTSAIMTIDDLLENATANPLLKDLFYGEATNVSDTAFGSYLASGPNSVQGQNWDTSFYDPNVDNVTWRSLCDALGKKSEPITLGGVEIPSVVVNFANWQVANVAPPDPSHPRIVSKFVTSVGLAEFCNYQFPPGKFASIPAVPDVESINAFGGLDIAADRLAFIDGTQDPWLGATPHSWLAKNRTDTVQRPFKLIPNGVHRYDENGMADHSKEPAYIQQIHTQEVEFVRGWLKEWKN
ncbi:hypothetical protein BOTBODRAFT_648619 [Botryobasidium botryosum FD-172 SS1]|uniref:Peptidase S28 n=1 Tax=Botryobasidium botryosum (strain FD-172 SS1) TaxID=930990 RepID=A0A067MZG1_BOTB1|nr:hypothetical protein BOTBODRAFT_648619 [Botryobasidium botryosum FD-172 SS1]